MRTVKCLSLRLDLDSIVGGQKNNPRPGVNVRATGSRLDSYLQQQTHLPTTMYMQTNVTLHLSGSRECQNFASSHDRPINQLESRESQLLDSEKQDGQPAARNVSHDRNKKKAAPQQTEPAKQ